MGKCAMIINNEGFPIGAFSIEEGCGGDRILNVLGPMLAILDLRIIIGENAAFAIYPAHFMEDVDKFISGLTQTKHIQQFKSPARG